MRLRLLAAERVGRRAMKSKSYHEFIITALSFFFSSRISLTIKKSVDSGARSRFRLAKFSRLLGKVNGPKTSPSL
jgi:hypothetical protein